nr:uncharacterized protein LOC127315075 [Lolium perenne]
MAREELAVATATEDAAADNEHLAILISLLAMIVEEDKPTIGGSALGHRKSKSRQRMKLSLKIVENLREIDYFKLKRDAVGELGDTHDDYLRMTESTTTDSMYRFCWEIVAVFGKTYLRTPNAADTTRILAQNEERCFSGMLGRQHNDINVLLCSDVFQKLVEGDPPPVQLRYWPPEASRKDVERAFGVLQARFSIVRYPALTWSKEHIWEMLITMCLSHLLLFSPGVKKFETPTLITNCKMIWWSI